MLGDLARIIAFGFYPRMSGAVILKLKACETTITADANQYAVKRIIRFDGANGLLARFPRDGESDDLGVFFVAFVDEPLARSSSSISTILEYALAARPSPLPHATFASRVATFRDFSSSMLATRRKMPVSSSR